MPFLALSAATSDMHSAFQSACVTMAAVFVLMHRLFMDDNAQKFNLFNMFSPLSANRMQMLKWGEMRCI